MRAGQDDEPVRVALDFLEVVDEDHRVDQQVELALSPVGNARTIERSRIRAVSKTPSNCSRRTCGSTLCSAGMATGGSTGPKLVAIRKPSSLISPTSRNRGSMYSARASSLMVAGDGGQLGVAGDAGQDPVGIGDEFVGPVSGDRGGPVERGPGGPSGLNIRQDQEGRGRNRRQRHQQDEEQIGFRLSRAPRLRSWLLL